MLTGLCCCQSETLSQEVVTTEQTLKSSTMEVKAVKTQLQALEIELQSQLSMVSTALAHAKPGSCPVNSSAQVATQLAASIGPPRRVEFPGFRACFFQRADASFVKWRSGGV